MKRYPRGVIIREDGMAEDVIEFHSKDLINYPNVTVTRRIAGEFKNKALSLDNGYDWAIVTDTYGIICLVPTKRGDVE